MNTIPTVVGAFLLVLGVTTILAIPSMFNQFGSNYLAPPTALFITIVASVGGAILEDGVSSSLSKHP